MSKRLEKLLEQEQAIQAKIKHIRAKENVAHRKLENRKKVLIGAAVLQKIKFGDLSEDWLRSLMDDFLVRPHERTLFDLPVSNHAPHPAGSNPKAQPVVENLLERTTLTRNPKKQPESRQIQKRNQGQEFEPHAASTPSTRSQSEKTGNRRLPESNGQESLLEQFNL